MVLNKTEKQQLSAPKNPLIEQYPEITLCADALFKKYHVFRNTYPYTHALLAAQSSLFRIRVVDKDESLSAIPQVGSKYKINLNNYEPHWKKLTAQEYIDSQIDILKTIKEEGRDHLFLDLITGANNVGIDIMLEALAKSPPITPNSIWFWGLFIFSQNIQPRSLLQEARKRGDEVYKTAWSVLPAPKNNMNDIDNSVQALSEEAAENPDIGWGCLVKHISRHISRYIGRGQLKVLSLKNRLLHNLNVSPDVFRSIPVLYGYLNSKQEKPLVNQDFPKPIALGFIDLVEVTKQISTKYIQNQEYLRIINILYGEINSLYGNVFHIGISNSKNPKTKRLLFFVFIQYGDEKPQQFSEQEILPITEQYIRGLEGVLSNKVYNYMHSNDAKDYILKLAQQKALYLKMISSSAGANKQTTKKI